MLIRRATPADFESMWAIFQAVIAQGDALPFSPGFARDTFHAHWFGDHAAYVAVSDGEVVGMYKLGANYPDLGAHVASATYAVRPDAQSQGIGRALVQHSLAEAEHSGFDAMQFNYVVSTNTAAVELYKKLGFSIAGTLPQAFQHQQYGLVDAYVMFRFLRPQLTLRLLSLDDLHALAASQAPAAVRIADGALPPAMVAERSLHQLALGKPAQWCSTFFIIRTTDQTIVGGCGFKDAPRAGRVEIGYAVAPACRGQGIAPAAVSELARIAFADPEVGEVLAQVDVNNAASTRVMQKLQFASTGVVVDEDNDHLQQWLLRRPLKG